MSVDTANEKELLREEFELISANIKCILSKNKDKVTASDRDFLLSAIRKVIFIKNSFDVKSQKFAHILKGVGLVNHHKNAKVFEKGDQGDHFYIVLEGVYCVEIDNAKQGKKEKHIYYYPGDSFGEVSLIYDVARGTRIISDDESCLMAIPKQTFNECGDLRKSILYLNKYFENHPFFENQSQFMIRVVSSISKLQKFTANQIIIDEGCMFNEILFFAKGQAKVFKTLVFEDEKGTFTETIEIETLAEGSVYGEHFYTGKIPSTVRITGITRGQYIRVNFKDDVHTVQNALYKRIRQNALRFPTNSQLFDQYYIYLVQKVKQVQYLVSVYKKDGEKQREMRELKQKIKRISKARLIEKII